MPIRKFSGFLMLRWRKILGDRGSTATVILLRILTPAVESAEYLVLESDSEDRE
jgi:hypothetical protein